ncbi:MAG: hypothetical protein QM773_13385 [Hyphomonadaceae bacterium]
MRALWLSIGLLLAMLSGCAVGPSLPPDLNDYEGYVERLDAAPLWPTYAIDGYTRRLRLTLGPPFVGQAASIRIDIPERGQPVGYAVRTRLGVHGRKITQRHRFAPKPGELEQLDELIEAADVWQFERGSWQMDPEGGKNVICIDGVQLIFERATKEGYRFSEANAQCTASYKLLRVAEQMITMAGLEKSGVDSWIY